MSLKEFLDDEFKNLEYYLFNNEWLQDLRDDFSKLVNVWDNEEKYEELVNEFDTATTELAKETLTKLRKIFEALQEKYK